MDQRPRQQACLRQNGGAIMAMLCAAALLLALLVPGACASETLGASARLDPADGLRLHSDHAQITLELPLSQAVPWRVRTLPAPPRLVIDLNAVDWTGVVPGNLIAQAGPAVRDLRLGRLGSGWSRMVLDMTGPYRVQQAELRGHQPSGSAVLTLRLERVDDAGFAAHAQDAEQYAAAHGAALLDAATPVPARAAPARRLVVMLDPGHGGLDPGAERDGLRESDLMLGFARELRDALRRSDGFEVAMTRDADIFVSLDGRIRAARAAGADVLLSLHADALPDGIAAGATLYTLSDEASDASAQILAERHDRADLLAGVDLARAEDAIADVLMSMTRAETTPRTKALSAALVAQMRAANLRLHRRPVQSGAFSVLRAPDIPSVLIELGFMSNPRDLRNLQDPDWRARMVNALVLGLQDWAQADMAEADLRRR